MRKAFGGHSAHDEDVLEPRKAPPVNCHVLGPETNDVSGADLQIDDVEELNPHAHACSRSSNA